MIKAIIFDLDDTLLEFSKFGIKEVLDTAKKLNLKKPDIKKVNKLWGTTIKSIVEKTWGKRYVKSFKKEFIRLQKTKKFHPTPYALSIIKKLKTKYTLGIVSSKTKGLIKLHMKRAGFNIRDFLFINAAEDSKYNKPDPRVFSDPKKRLKKTMINHNEIIYIGDSIFDYIAAKKAKLKFIAVTTGHYTKKDFEKKGLNKKFILHSLKGIEKCLNAYFAK